MLKPGHYLGVEGSPEAQVLNAFSSADLAVYVLLDPAARASLYRDVAFRLVALASISGISAAKNAERMLATPTEDTVQDLLSSVFGSQRKLASELQEEVVHFSRIVDLDWFKYIVPVKRVRGSSRLPDNAKFLTELLLVARSRFFHNGVRIPKLQRLISTSEVKDGFMMELWGGSSCMYIRNIRRRISKQYCYYASIMLEYISPYDVMFVLSYICAMKSDGSTDLSLVINSVVALRREASATPAFHDHGSWLASYLPKAMEIADYPDLQAVVDLSGHYLRKRTNQPSGAEERSIPPEDISTILQLLAEIGADVDSLECGHIHLDRAFDQDQLTGASIGRSLATALHSATGLSPKIIPLVDDDHVSCALSPNYFIDQLRARTSLEADHVVPESSPLVRAIIDVLFADHLVTRPERLKYVGQNIYYFSKAGIVELFEDIAGDKATGCIFFEVALLIYRSAPTLFRPFLIDECGTNVHEKILSNLSSSDDYHVKHSRDLEIKAAFRRRVCLQTDKFEDLRSVVRDVLKTPRLHINVLERYYSGQQNKVRWFLRELEFPVDLITVLFDVDGQIEIEY